jgi:predicted TIM-barrel fold metal-dependent hydrolase
VSLGSSGIGGGGGGAEVVTERVLEMVRSCMQTWQQEKMDLSQRLTGATMSLEALEAERNAAGQAATRYREVAAEELQSQRAAAAAAEAKHVAELKAQSVQVETMRRERESWQAVREKVRDE